MSTLTLHVRKNDMIQVMRGAHKGKTGKISQILRDERKVFVEKINLAKKHVKPSQKNPQGGIVEIEKSIHASSVLLLCGKCNKGVRVFKKDVKGKEKRFCKKCKAQIDK